MNIKNYLCVSDHLLLAITLQPASEKQTFLYLRSKRLSKFHFQKFESSRSPRQKFYFFIPLGIQIEIDFHPQTQELSLTHAEL